VFIIYQATAAESEKVGALFARETGEHLTHPSCVLIKYGVDVQNKTRKARCFPTAFIVNPFGTVGQLFGGQSSDSSGGTGRSVEEYLAEPGDA
jgi:hypothetical protein